jgi:excisionase family DNA binding protein
LLDIGCQLRYTNKTNDVTPQGHKEGSEMALLDIKQIKERLHLSERTIFRMMKAGDLKGFKLGREWRFEEKDIEDLIKLQRARASQLQKAEGQGQP